MKLHASGEDYLETILVLQKEKGMVRSVDVARRMGVSKLGGCPPIIKQNEYDIHTVVLQGAAVFFYSTDFSLFSGTFLLSNKSRQTCAYIIRCVRFFFSEKCPFLLIVYRTSLFYCRGPPGLNFFQKNSD